MTLKILYFYSDRCHHCTNFKDEWTKFKNMILGNNNVEYVEIINNNKHNELYSRFNIRGIPTIVLLSDNINQEYKGDRTASELYSYISRLNI